MKLALQKRVVLDACVLYPAPLRDFLLSVAFEEVFIPLWSDEIQHEWVRNLLFNRLDLDKDRLEKSVEIMNLAFPNANVEFKADIIEKIELPDIKDHHVLETAIHSQASVILTFNLRDFPNDLLSKFGIVSLHPDDFLMELTKELPVQIQSAFDQMVNRLRNPVKSKIEVKCMLERCGLTKTVRYLV
jgi:predicted nucleic acid-binding protein